MCDGWGIMVTGKPELRKGQLGGMNLQGTSSLEPRSEHSGAEHCRVHVFGGWLPRQIGLDLWPDCCFGELEEGREIGYRS